MICILINNIINVSHTYKLCKFHWYLITGTKQCYTGPLHLVESIRIALGNISDQKEQSSSSEPEHPGDKPIDNRSGHATSDTNRKNETDAKTKRQKMP